jgi:hypothetical protein
MKKLKYADANVFDSYMYGFMTRRHSIPYSVLRYDGNS